MRLLADLVFLTLMGTVIFLALYLATGGNPIAALTGFGGP